MISIIIKSPPSNPVEYVVPDTTNTVAVQANPASTGSVNGGGSFATGSSVTVTATANSGYTFTDWTENGTVQSASPSYSFTLATNRTLVANFTANPTTNTVAVQASPASAGSVNGGGSFVTGSSVTVTATANSGYTFTNWTERSRAKHLPQLHLHPGHQPQPGRQLHDQSDHQHRGRPGQSSQRRQRQRRRFLCHRKFCDRDGHRQQRLHLPGWTQNGTVQSTSPSYIFTLATNRNLVRQLHDQSDYLHGHPERRIEWEH